MSTLDKPITRQELYLSYLNGNTSIQLPEPITRIERYLYALCVSGGGSGGKGRLKTIEEIEANTEEGYDVDALPVKEINGRFGGITGFIVDEDSGQITGYKTKAGADTVFPFKPAFNWVLVAAGSTAGTRTASGASTSNSQVVSVSSTGSTDTSSSTVTITIKKKMSCNIFVGNTGRGNVTLTILYNNSSKDINYIKSIKSFNANDVIKITCTNLVTTGNNGGTFSGFYLGMIGYDFEL